MWRQIRSGRNISGSRRCGRTISGPGSESGLRKQHMTRAADNRSDAELLDACGRAEADAWDALVDRYGRLVYSIPTRLGLRSDECDDVYQVVWSIAVRHVVRIREPERLGAWLAMTTRRECWRRLRSRESTTGDAEPLESAIDSPSVSLARLEQDQALRRAMQELDATCRELLMALFSGSDRPSYDVIADQLGMPRGSIGPRRARCLERLGGLIPWKEGTLP